MYDIIEAYMKHKNDHLKIFEVEYETNFDVYRKINEEEMKKYISKILRELPIHKLLQQLILND